MIIVTRKQFLDWLKSQPKDREFDYFGCRLEDSCYCPMMAYAVDNNIPATSCSSAWYNCELDVAQFEPNFGFNSFNLPGKFVTAAQLVEKIENG